MSRLKNWLYIIFNVIFYLKRNRNKLIRINIHPFILSILIAICRLCWILHILELLTSAFPSEKCLFNGVITLFLSFYDSYTNQRSFLCQSKFKVQTVILCSKFSSKSSVVCYYWSNFTSRNEIQTACFRSVFS